MQELRDALPHVIFYDHQHTDAVEPSATSPLLPRQSSSPAPETFSSTDSARPFRALRNPGIIPARIYEAEEPLRFVCLGRRGDMEAVRVQNWRRRFWYRVKIFIGGHSSLVEEGPLE